MIVCPVNCDLTGGCEHCRPYAPHVGPPYGLRPPAPLGWECPKCGAIWAPGVEECKRCKPPETLAFQVGTSSTTMVLPEGYQWSYTAS